MKHCYRRWHAFLLELELASLVDANLFTPDHEEVEEQGGTHIQRIVYFAGAIIQTVVGLMIKAATASATRAWRVRSFVAAWCMLHTQHEV